TSQTVLRLSQPPSTRVRRAGNARAHTEFREASSRRHEFHKANAIQAILAMYPEVRFALIGDDIQGDLPAYAGAVEWHPAQIPANFIRTTSRQARSPEKEKARSAIQAAVVPLWLGDSFAIGKEFVASAGFGPGGETEQIVRAVERVPTK